MNNFLSNAMKKSMGLLSSRTNQCLIITLFILFFCQNSTAQQQRLGLANSNYGGVVNLMTNPADIAGGRYNTYIGLGQLDLHFTNNYFKLRNYNFLKFGGTSDTLTLTNKKGDYLSTGFDLAGLSWIQSINPKMAFGLSSRVRGTFQAVGITGSFYNTLGNNNISPKDTLRDIKGGGFNVGGQIFSEIDASFAYTLVDNKDYALKIGTTVKSLRGALAGGFSLSQFDATRTNTPDVDKYKVTNGLLNIAYFGVDSLDTNTSTDFKPSDIFGGGGKGFGFDIGATYEHRVGSFNNSDGSTPYLFRVGASVTDLGSIKYSSKYIRYYTANLKNLSINTKDSTFSGNSDEVLKAAKINKDSFATSFSAQIPTMLRLNADIRLDEHFFVNAYLAQSLANKYQLGTQYASFIAVTPRFESRYFDFSLPLALTNNYKTFGMGFGMRLGPVTLGMDNFTGFLGNPSGLNAHAGLNIGIGRKKNAQAEAEKAKEKEKEAEVAEAKNASKEKAKKRSKKEPKEEPLSNEPMKAPEAVESPKPVKSPEAKPMDVPEQEVVVAKPSAPKMAEKAKPTPAKTAEMATVAPKPTAPKVEENKQKMPEKVPNLLENAPKPSAPSATTKPQQAPAKAPTSVNVAPKPAAVVVPTPTTKVAEAPAKSTKEGPLSITPPKAPAATVVTPKPTAPVVVEKPKTVTLSPIGSGKMGECIEFFPNKAAITGNSLVCLKEISKLLMSNKSIKLNVAASVLSTEKVADATTLKAERAKTIRNFLIQSGVEASRIAIKMNATESEAPITLTAQ
jgi:hypothetical protein